MNLQLSDKAYNILKWLVQLVLPAVATLYFTLAAIWGLPGGESVVGTIAAITTFLGVTLGISTKKYYESDAPFDGSIIVQEVEPGQKMFTLELDGDPNEIEHRKHVSFKVSEE